MPIELMKRVEIIKFNNDLGKEHRIRINIWLKCFLHENWVAATCEESVGSVFTKILNCIFVLLWNRILFTLALFG